jgi:hypothetical protein
MKRTKKQTAVQKRITIDHVQQFYPRAYSPMGDSAGVLIFECASNDPYALRDVELTLLAHLGLPLSKNSPRDPFLHFVGTTHPEGLGIAIAMITSKPIWRLRVKSTGRSKKANRARSRRNTFWVTGLPDWTAAMDTAMTSLLKAICRRAAEEKASVRVLLTSDRQWTTISRVCGNSVPFKPVKIDGYKGDFNIAFIPDDIDIT